MADYEQPDSTTMPEQEVPVTDDLVSFEEENKTEKPEEFIAPPKEESNTDLSVSEKTPNIDEQESSECPMNKFLVHLGECVPAPVYDILVWKDVYKTAVIFFTILPLLVLYCYCNPIVVTAYLLLGLVTTTTTYRIYRYVLDSFQKAEVLHPFKDIADLEVDASRKLVFEWADRVLPICVKLLNKVKHYVLVEDIVDTAKFAVILYVSAVVGGFFSLRMLFILGFVGAFTLPKVYSLYKPQINDFHQKLHTMFEAQLKIAKKKFYALKDQVMNAAAKKRD